MPNEMVSLIGVNLKINNSCSSKERGGKGSSENSISSRGLHSCYHYGEEE